MSVASFEKELWSLTPAQNGTDVPGHFIGQLLRTCGIEVYVDGVLDVVEPRHRELVQIIHGDAVLLRDLHGDGVVFCDIVGVSMRANAGWKGRGGGEHHRGASGFQFRNDFGIFTAPDSGGAVSQVFRGIGLSASRPFSSFTRLDFGADFNFVNQDVRTFSFITGATGSEAELGNAFFTTFRGSLVHDTSSFGLAAPFSGTRARLTLSQSVGDLRFSSLLLDYRKYFPIKIPRVTYAYRFVAGGSFGRDERLFRIGGPFNFRGADFGELVGTRTFFSNSELRFPLLPFAPIQYDFLTGVAFFDSGTAWFGNDFNFKDIQTAYGFGVRMNLGGLLKSYHRQPA